MIIIIIPWNNLDIALGGGGGWLSLSPFHLTTLLPVSAVALVAGI